MKSGSLDQVADGIWIATANLWMTRSTVIVAGDGQAIVVDPGITPTEMTALAAQIRDRGWHVVAGFSTHSHWDHVLWHPNLGNVPRWTTRRARVAGLAAGPESLQAARVEVPDIDASTFGRTTATQRSSIQWAGPALRIIAHDGHSPGHAGLLIEESGVLLTGDMLSDREIPLLDLDGGDPVGDYATGLQRLAEAAQGVAAIVPGHGTTATGAQIAARFEMDSAYLESRRHARTDPRLADEWVAAEHAKQVHLLPA